MSTTAPAIATTDRLAAGATWSLAALSLGTFGSGTAAFVVAGVLPEIGRGIGVSQAAAGSLLTAFAVVYALAAPLLTWASARRDVRFVLSVALGLFVLGNAACALAPSYPILLMGRAVAGAGAGLFVPAAAAVGARLVSERYRGRAIAVVVAGSSAANVLGVPLGVLLATRGTWRLPFASLAGLSCATLFVILRALPRLPSPGVASARDRFAALARPRLMLALLATMLWTAGGFTAYTYVAPLLAARAGLGPAGLALALLAFGAGSVAGNFLGGIAADSRFAVAACAAALFGGAALMATLTSADNLALAVTWLLAWGTIAWIFYVPQQTRLLRLLPSQPALALSLNLSVLYIGIAAGSATGGALVAAGQLPAVGLAGAVFSGLAAIVFIAGLRPTRFNKEQQDEVRPLL